MRSRYCSFGLRAVVRLATAALQERATMVIMKVFSMFTVVALALVLGLIGMTRSGAFSPVKVTQDKSKIVLAATPTIGPVSITPQIIGANIPTILKVTVQIKDPSLVPQTVQLRRMEPGGVGGVLARLNDDGKDGDLVAGDQVYTGTYSASLPLGSTKFAVSAVFRAFGPVVSDPISVISLQVPPTFTVNMAAGAAGGPLALTNFGDTFSQGGILPGYGAAEIDVTTVPPPSVSLNDFVSTELKEANISAMQTFQVGQVTCVQAFYTDTFTPTLSYANEAVYCPTSQLLYKFYLTYLPGDPSEANFIASFSQVVSSATLVP